MLRRHFLRAAAGLLMIPIVGCTGTSADTTVQGIIDWLKSNCSFVANVQSITAVITSFIGSFNAAAGAGAVVVAAVAKQVEDAVCNAVKQTVVQMKAENKLAASTGGGQDIKIIVNGVEVPGTYTGG